MACHGRLHDTAVPAPWKLSYAPCQQGGFPLSFLSLPPPLSLFFSIPSHPCPSHYPSLSLSPSSLSLSLSFSPCLSSFLFAPSGSSWEVHIPYPGETQVGLLLSPSKWRWWAFQRRAIAMVPFVLHPTPTFFFFLLPSPSSLSSSSSSSLSCLPSQLNSPVCSSSLERQQSPSLKVLTHTFSGQPMCLWMTLPGQEQWSNFSFLPELTTALAVAAALFSS